MKVPTKQIAVITTIGLSPQTSRIQGKALGNTRLLDGDTQHDGTGKHHQNLPVDGLHRLIHITAAEEQHRYRRQESTLQQRNNIESREYHHRHHDRSGDQRLLTDVRHLVAVKEVQFRRQTGLVDLQFRRTVEQQRVTSL